MKILLRLLVLFFIFSSQFGYASVTKIFPFNLGNMVYSQKHKKVFVLVGPENPIVGNCLLQINPETLKVEKSVFVGSMPFELQLTADEDFVWVSLSGTGYIRRINLNSFVVDQEIFLGPHSFPIFGDCSTILARSLTSLSYNKIVVKGMPPNSHGTYSGIAVYENGKLLPKKINPDNTTPNDPHSFVPISNGKMLFGSEVWGNIQEIPTQISILNVDKDGIEYVQNFKQDLYGGNFKAHNDTIYFSYGSIIDASDITNLRMLGKCEHDMISSDHGFTYSEIHKAYIYPSLKDSLLHLVFYNKDTYEPVDSVYVDLPYEYRTTMKYVRNLEVIDKGKFCLRIIDNDGYSLLVFSTTKLSNDASLTKLDVANFQRLLPDFSPDISEYKVLCPEYSGTNPEPFAVTNHGKATVKITHHVSLPSLSIVLVTAEDGVTTREYKLLYEVFTESDTDIPLGVEANPEDNIIVYPNPVKDIVCLTGLPPKSTVFIYDLQGKAIEFTDVVGISMEINMNHYPSGIYMLKIVGRNNEVITKKIIKE